MKKYLYPEEGREGARAVGVGKCSLWPLQCYSDERGNLTAAEFSRDLPFVPRRNFFIYGVADGAKRGGHAHRTCRFFLVAVSGALSVALDDGEEKSEIILNSPKEGLYLPERVWSVQYGFSKDTVLSVFASHEYKDDDYIRDYEEFRRYARE